MSPQVRRYFDHNATAPLRPEARRAWLEVVDRCWQNPSSLYRSAAEAALLLEDCRRRAADLLHCEPEDIVFTSGATESNNTVFRHFASRSGDSPSAVVSAVEHPSAAEPAARLFPGDRLHTLPCRPDGVTDLTALPGLLRETRPAVVSLMAANNETGALQPWREALALCEEHGAPFHCDATQWLGRLPSAGLGACGWVTGGAHKLGGPKGVGFLKAPAGRGPLAQHGGPQENRRRAGTEDLAGIAAMLAAWEAAESALPSPAGKADADTGGTTIVTALTSLLSAPRDAFEEAARRHIPEVTVVSAAAPRLWNTSLLLVPPPVNVKWLSRLDALGFQVSTGSACSRGQGASEVLAAMGVPAETLSRTLRFSSGPDHTAADWLALAEALASVRADLQTRRRPLTAALFPPSSSLPEATLPHPPV